MPFLLVCLIGLLISVQASPASSPVVEGQVRLAAGSPVAGAQVLLFDVADLRRGPIGQATTDEAGMFVLPLTAADGALVLPRAVRLGPNYPNPFNPSTIIPYQLATTSPVRLEVFNILGQRVATLVDEEQSAGVYRARWDGTDAAGGAAAAGVYLYRLTVAGAHQTGKMVLLDGQAGVPLGGAGVEVVSRAAGSTGSYGLVVAGEGLVTYVDPDFGGGMAAVDLVVAAERPGRGKVVPSLAGVLGDVDNNGRVDLDDGLLVAMYSVNPSLALPNHGLMALGDVNCDGRVELADAELLTSYVANPSDAAVASLQIGQAGGYSLNPVTEVVWGSILGNENADPVVARLLADVLVTLSGVLPVEGEDRVFLGIDREYWTAQGGKHIYETLKQRFPVTPIHVEPSIGVIRQAGKVATRPTMTALRQVTPVTGFGPPISFAESPHTALGGTTRQQHVVGRITVPDDVMVGSVAVAVDITHSFKSDLKIDLVAPSGVATTLYDGVRDGINPEANIVGTIATTDALQGQAAKGTWQLQVGDYERGDAGTLNSWTLTVTPAQDAPEAEEPVNLFLETFQEGLGAWSGSKWEAASLESDVTVPGEGPGNIVAKAQGCGVCFLSSPPIDLSAHDSVTLSFYRWMDPGMSNSEYLGVEIGNNGSYSRLKNWSQQHADGQWHLETFTLSGDQIGDTFSLRFFGITSNDFTTVAIDNVMITATPGSVVVVPETTEPDLAVTELSATPLNVTPGETISLQATISNTGAPTATRALFLRRHRRSTETPLTGGIPITTTGALLQKDSSRSVNLSAVAPQALGTYHYYACISALQEEDTGNNCASVVVMVQAEEEVETPTEETSGISATYLIKPTRPVQPGGQLTFYVRVMNTTDEDKDDVVFRLYQHERETTTPTTGGEEVSETRPSTITAGRSLFKALRASAPETPGTYYYYVCTGIDCTSAAAVTVQGEETPEEPETPSEPSEPETPQETVGFSVTNIKATPQSVQSTYALTITATITNTGSETDSAPISVYRHTRTTATPQSGGVKESNTATTGNIAPNASVTVTSTHEAPTVSQVTKYYYYLCADTFCSEPSEVVIRVKQEHEGPPYTSCRNIPESNLPMGGDVMRSVGIGDNTYNSCATITLGGVETKTGVQGFIISAHTVAPLTFKDDRWLLDYSRTDTLIGNSGGGSFLYHFLGRVFKAPHFYQEGDRRILSVDASLIAYPHPKTPGCSLTWSGNEEEFCLDVGASDKYIERLAPLQIRGANGAVYTVTGSQKVTEGLPVRFSGALSGEVTNNFAKGDVLLLGRRDVNGRFHEYINYTQGDVSIPGDSGSPVYTAPDTNGIVRIVGILVGGLPTNEGIAFHSWDKVEDTFDLKPVGN